MRFLTISFCLAASSVAAQDADSGNQLSFTLGLGAGSQPSYFGSENSNVGATGSFAEPSLSLGSFGFGGGDDADGFGVTGSFRYIGARTAADNPELTGLADVAASLEAGGGFTYTTSSAEILRSVDTASLATKVLSARSVAT